MISSYWVWWFLSGNTVRHCELNIKFIVVLEHFLLMCKRKRSQKKSTRAVPARHPTAAAQTRTRRLFSTCSAHAPANSLLLRQCGLVRTALPSVPSPLSGSNSVCAAACGGLFFQYSRSNVCKWCHSEKRCGEESLKFFGALKDSSLRSEWQVFMLCGLV